MVSESVNKYPHTLFTIKTIQSPTVIIWHAGHKAIEYNATIYNDNASREELHQRIHTQKQMAGHAAIVLLSIQVFCYFLLTMFAIYERQR